MAPHRAECRAARATQVQFHLPLVGGLKLAELEFDRHQPAEASVVEEQVEIVLLVVDRDPLLPGDKGEIAPHFQDERLQLAEDRLLHVLFGVESGQSQEVQEIRVAKTKSGVIRSSSRSAARSAAISSLGFLLTAVRS